MKEDLKSHRDGELETVKFSHRRGDYERYLTRLPLLGVGFDEIIEHFPAFVGHMTLNRFLTLYELYKKVLSVSGHIAEVGVYKGAGSLFFGKLIRIFEPESLTMAHGFDWFSGTAAVPENPLQVQGGNLSDEGTLREIIDLQGLENIVKIHKLNAEADFPDFFSKHPHLRFKLVFLDSGTYEVTSASIKALWPRITPGGILVLDQFNNEVAPGETRAVCELLPREKIETLPNSWMPGSFIRKKYS